MGITPLSFAFFPRGGATARTSNPRPGPRARRRGHLAAYRRVLWLLLLGHRLLLLGRRLLLLGHRLLLLGRCTSVQTFVLQLYS